MSDYKGINFPFMFKGGRTDIVSELDKVKADIALLIRQESNVVLFKPGMGVNFDYILFAGDISITRDFVMTFVSAAISNLSNVKLIDAVVTPSGPALRVSLHFEYTPDSTGFSLEYLMEGTIYETS